MESNILLVGFVFLVFYLASFFSVKEADIGYWAGALWVSTFGLAIKGYILQHTFSDWTCYDDDIPVEDTLRRKQAFVVNILFVLAMLIVVMKLYFLE